jgi:hypothetical protein
VQACDRSHQVRSPTSLRSEAEQPGRPIRTAGPGRDVIDPLSVSPETTMAEP